MRKPQDGSVRRGRGVRDKGRRKKAERDKWRERGRTEDLEVTREGRNKHWDALRHDTRRFQ